MKMMKKNQDLSIRGGSNEHGVTGSMTVTAGEKCKIIGWQDGSFQKFGHHLRNEMGGIWAYPLKAADGFWLRVNGAYPTFTEYETLPYGTLFRAEPLTGLKMTRFQFVPDDCCGTVISYHFENNADSPLELDLAFTVRFQILPVWFSEESGIHDEEDDAWIDESGFVLAKDRGHEWYAGFCGEHSFRAEAVVIDRKDFSPAAMAGRGVTASASSILSLAPGEGKTVRYFLAGSYTGKNALLADLWNLRGCWENLLQKKLARYQGIRSKTALQTSDPDFDQVFEWIKYNNDWLISDSGEFGRGLAAGLPEYPWWFGYDNAYSTQGLMAIGEFETARDTLCLLERYSQKVNGNGRIVHEITNNGNCPNPGNSQETGHFITAVYNYWRWTGDTRMVAELYDYCARGIDWLLHEMDPDGDLLPSGYGIIEIKGLNVELIDTAVYTCQALFRMAEMAAALGRDGSGYRETAAQLRKVINTRLWNEKEQLYVDAVGTAAQILDRIDILLNDEKHGPEVDEAYRAYLLDMQTRLKAMPQDEEAPFLINKNWVINTPMETGLADREKALAALETMRSDEFVGDYGLYLAGFMHHHTMTISTGVQAVAEGRYGCTDQSLELLRRMCKTFSMVLPGSISEMSPNYGCFTQAWTVYAMMVPVVECFAGFQPMIPENRLTLAPCVPSQWDRMELLNVRVGNAFVDFSFTREEDHEIYRIHSTGDFTIAFAPVCGGQILLNGAPAEGTVTFGRGSNVIEVLA